MERCVREAWNTVSYELDLPQWDNAIERILEWASNNVVERIGFLSPRVPLPVTHSHDLYLSAGLFALTLDANRGRILAGTWALMWAQAFVFLLPDGVPLTRVSLLPYRVLDKSEFYRLLTAGFVHLDLTHALFNVAGLIEAGTVLEPQMGAVPFLLDTAMITVVSHGLYVWAAWLEKSFLKRHMAYYAQHGVGFSAVLFGLDALNGAIRESDPNILSFWPIPYGHVVWLNLAITTLCFQSSNHLGHLCGLVAGLVRVFVPWPFVWIRKAFTHLVGLVLDRDIDNRSDEETKLKGYRTPLQLMYHLGFLTTSVVIYLLKTDEQRTESPPRWLINLIDRLIF